jgi:hypothetical protein
MAASFFKTSYKILLACKIRIVQWQNLPLDLKISRAMQPSRRGTTNRKLIVYVGIGLFLTAGIAATPKPSIDSDGKNLKVLPKNIGGDQIERIMHKMSHDLGVMCSNCHPYTKPDVSPMRVDFVTDEMPDKNIARKMMIMTDKLNKKYFGFKNDYSDESINRKNIITCNTCHLGSIKPDSHFIIPTPD